MNITLLKQVRDKIAAEPYQFEMNWYFSKHLGSKDASKIKIPNCVTAACIAGWTLSIYKEKNPNLIPDRGLATGREAADILEIKHHELLFHVGYWPAKFKTLNGIGFSYLTKKQQAKLAVKRINHFIKTGGME